MKIKILTILLIILLASCTSKDPIIKDPTEPIVEDPIKVVPESPEDPVLTIEFLQDLTLVDISDDYDLQATSLRTYRNSLNEGVSYVNIEEFIAFQNGGIEVLTIVKTDKLALSYEVEVQEDFVDYLGEYYTYEMIIDGHENSIYFNDIDMIESLGVSPETDYSQGLEIVDFTFNEVDFSRTIDFDDYEMDIVVFNNNYFIPFYLANFLISGDFLLCETDTELIMFDQMTDKDILDKEFENRTHKQVDQLATETYNYLALYFDYSYGLLEFKEIDDMHNLLDNYEIESATSFTKLTEQINYFLNDLDDLHTMFSSAGYNYPYYQSFYNRSHDSKLMRYVDALNLNACFESTENVTFNVIDDVAYFVLNGFSLELPEELAEFMPIAKNYDDVVFDLRCNGGGLITSAIHLLTYMTDEDIPVSYLDPYTNLEETVFYRSIESN